MVPWPQVGVAGAGWVLSFYFTWMVYTGRLVARKTHQDVIDDRNDWKNMALRSLGVTERMTKPVEVVADVMTRLPDPGTPPEGRDS